MIPVLRVKDPVSAGLLLHKNFGFEPSGPLWQLGEQSIRLVVEGEVPEHFTALPFDHLAIAASDIDKHAERFQSKGAILSKDYTPDGPREIAEFWEQGVRYIFFNGPDNAPLEFCEIKGRPHLDHFGHSHIGVRRSSIAEAMNEISHVDAKLIASYRLDGGGTPVNVAFVNWGNVVLEFFDEPAPTSRDETGWIGFVRS
jgi:catechol 2,3-dioxygenase-like lactoylglutathione lyase family enzyme